MQGSRKLLVARGATKAIGVAHHAPPSDCACGISGTICVEIDPVFADRTSCGAIPITISGYAIVADHTCRPAVAVAVSAYAFAADRTRGVAVPIVLNAHAVIADRTCRVARSVRVKATLCGQ